MILRFISFHPFTAVLLATLGGIVCLFLPIATILPIRNESDLSTLRGAGLLSAAAAFALVGYSMLRYLAVGRSEPKDMERGQEWDQAELHKLTAHLNHIDREVAAFRTSKKGIDLSAEDKEVLVSRLKDEVVTAGASAVMEQLQSRIVQTNRELEAERQYMARWESIRGRLLQEIERLSKGANLNLVIGILTTIAAASLLAFAVLQTPSKLPSDYLQMVPPMLLRLSLAVFVEVFSFFFLRLYKANQQEIKFFQNELTNIECRARAVETAMGLKDQKIVGELLRELSRTERNIILKQGERTVQMASEEAEGELLSRIYAGLSAMSGAQAIIPSSAEARGKARPGGK